MNVVAFSLFGLPCGSTLKISDICWSWQSSLIPNSTFMVLEFLQAHMILKWKSMYTFVHKWEYKVFMMMDKCIKTNAHFNLQKLIINSVTLSDDRCHLVAVTQNNMVCVWKMTEEWKALAWQEWSRINRNSEEMTVYIIYLKHLYIRKELVGWYMRFLQFLEGLHVRCLEDEGGVILMLKYDDK